MGKKTNSSYQKTNPEPARCAPPFRNQSRKAVHGKAMQGELLQGLIQQTTDQPSKIFQASEKINFDVETKQGNENVICFFS